MTQTDFVNATISAYASIAAICVPIVAIIGMCNIGINVLINAFMGHGLHIGGGK